jgi:hypothetical protein
MRFPTYKSFRDGNGVIVSGATVMVYLTGTTTPATIYAASSGGSPVTSLTTDANGTILFYADDANYSILQLCDIVATATGGWYSVTLTGVPLIPYDRSVVPIMIPVATTTVSSTNTISIQSIVKRVIIKPLTIYNAAATFTITVNATTPTTLYSGTLFDLTGNISGGIVSVTPPALTSTAVIISEPWAIIPNNANYAGPVQVAVANASQGTAKVFIEYSLWTAS